jgi:tRNA-dependent cyclodipeptide synthase
MMAFRYRIAVQECPGWRQAPAASLCVSVPSPEWQGKKFESIIAFATKHFPIVRVMVGDAVYRHNLMAQGSSPAAALAEAQAMGDTWMEKHAHLLPVHTCPPLAPQPLIIKRWAEYYAHPEWESIHGAFQKLYSDDRMFRAAVSADTAEFQRRAKRDNVCEAEAKRWAKHSADFLVDEITVFTLEARLQPSVTLYPGAELQVARVVRSGQVSAAPSGLARARWGRIKFDRRRDAPPAEIAERQEWESVQGTGTLENLQPICSSHRVKPLA